MLRVHELALVWGRKRQSKATTFLHFNPHDPYGDGKDVIPFYENILFVLALLRSKMIEQVEEAKNLLEKLLLFEVDGQFPRFLHEYPRCFDQCLKEKLVRPFALIKSHFEPVLGKELNEKLKPFIFPLPPLITDYHPGLGCYMGPYEEIWQERGEPALTFHDLQGSSESGHFPSRVLSDHPLHLHGVLVEPFCPKESIKREEWTLYQTQNYAYSVRKQWKEDGKGASKGFHLFALLWGNGGPIHSLVCQKKNEMISNASEKSIQLLFTLPEQIPTEGMDRMEVLFYCDKQSDIALFINQEKATAFQMHETVEIRSPSLDICMTFEIVEGEGTFLGHLFPANRPSQCLPADQLRFSAYDWQIGLRTIRRTSRLKLAVKIKLNSSE